ncbi:MAG: GNAT family N-acetyltransferase [Reichenbachiella sp.]
MITFKHVVQKKDIESVAHLANKIWNQHFVPMIGQGQVDYMLKKFQSVAAILSQIEQGYDYFLITKGAESVGYIGLVNDPETNRMMISKIYIKEDLRGSGIGNNTLDFIVQNAKNDGIQSIWLTVNRDNDATVAWYIRKGFVKIREEKNDIGNGYYMDDFIMELSLK